MTDPKNPEATPVFACAFAPTDDDDAFADAFAPPVAIRPCAFATTDDDAPTAEESGAAHRAGEE